VRVDGRSIGPRPRRYSETTDPVHDALAGEAVQRGHVSRRQAVRGLDGADRRRLEVACGGEAPLVIEVMAAVADASATVRWANMPTRS
jgi:hypothetical protein